MLGWQTIGLEDEVLVVDAQLFYFGGLREFLDVVATAPKVREFEFSVSSFGDFGEDFVYCW